MSDRKVKLEEAVFNPSNQLNRSDVQHTVKIKEEPPEDQSPGVDQQDPQPLHIKEEEEELWTSLEREQLNVIVVFPLKSEDEEEKPLFELHQHQMDDREGPSSSSADQMKAEADGEDCGGADLNPHGDTSSSSETEVSEDDEEDEDVNHPDSHLKPFSDSGSTTEDSDDYWKESRAPESETPKYCLCFNPTPHYEAICSPPHSPPPKHKSNGNCSNRSERTDSIYCYSF
ncbi:actin-like protein ARP8 [Kryptolebias marmoratus]|uniref:actin-like protein ARP8 n=1 Tax=Kryptolebias marmoratus TaxID=37003 RepID=UPI000D5310FB|nr:actin-like protein ARP8 [Kryptolebias marmoratus]